MPALIGTVLEWAALVVFAGASIALARVDLREHRLPNRLLALSMGAVMLLLAGSSLFADTWMRFATACIAAVIYALGFLLLWLPSRGALGAGDVKLAPLIGMIAGWASSLAALLWVPLGVALVGLCIAMVAKSKRQATHAFGPSMLAGTWLGLLFETWLS